MKPLSDKKHNAIVDELKYGYYFPKDVAKAKEDFEKEFLSYLQDSLDDYSQGWDGAIRQCLAIHDKHFGELNEKNNKETR